MVILDTNVISELMREAPNEQVCDWLQSQRIFNLATTAITVAEIQKGLKRLPSGKRRQRLEDNFSAFMTQGFEGRILAFDEQSAQIYGEISAMREENGLHADPLDMMICSIAKNFEGSIATRNVKDFEGCGVKLIDPWSISF